LFEKNRITAELMGISLGDAHVKYNPEKSIYKYEIAFNSNEDKYLGYVKNFLKHNFGFIPSEYNRIDEATVVLSLGTKERVQNLLKLGLKSGSKVANQVSVPKWIKRDFEWIINNLEQWNIIYRPRVLGCLRGLIDTDGCFYINHHKSSGYTAVSLQFCNASRPLVEDFKDMCASIGIITSKVSEYTGTTEKGNKYISFRTSTESKEKVWNFINLVKPMKWVYNKNKIQNKLEDFGIKMKDVFVYKNK